MSEEPDRLHCTLADVRPSGMSLVVLRACVVCGDEYVC